MNKTLYEAAKSGKEQVLNEIGEVQGVANEVTPGGNTVLHIAAYHGSLQFLQKLLQLSIANPEDGMPFLRAKNMEGNTALHEGAMGGNEQVVEDLLKSCPNLVNEINKAGETALFKACEGGHLKIVEMLCCQTSREYYKRFDGQTVLHLAVLNLRKGVIKKLLDERPELAKEVDNFHRTPLHMAALIPAISMNPKKIAPIGDMLIKEDTLSPYKVDQNRQSALHIAAKEGNAPLLKVILNYSSDCLEVVDNDGRNALHLAVKNAPQIFERVGGDLKTIICSVISERLINCIDNNGQTALDIALENEDEDPQLYLSIKNYLKKCGATSKILDRGSMINSPSKVRKTEWKPEFISVTAVLIATVAFAAAFTLPGGIDTQDQGQGIPLLINTILFKVFVILDTMAFCSSIASAILLTFAFYASQVEDPALTEISLYVLWIALVSLLLTFGAAIHLVVASKCLWLAVLVWVMVCILPMCIRVLSLGGKLYLFTPRKHYIKFLVWGFSLASGHVKSGSNI
ncbi:hypothetical protein SUGI_0425140 [Cryptomeria japonica]|nr:hypothetical protein SUGI_0425140 [Cryptomeria japonica]